MISGAVSGLYMGIVHLKSFAFAIPSLLSLPQFVNAKYFSNIINAVFVAVISIVLTFILTMVFGFKDDPDPSASKTVAPAAAGASASATATVEQTSSTVASGAKTTKKVFSPVKGELITMESVNDATFAQKMLGDGAAVIPEDNHFYAPFDGVIETVFPTKHAIGLKSDTGIEVLIHIGLDTVELKGKYYTAHVEANQRVKKGDLLMDADLDAIKKAGYDTTTPVVVTNTKDFVEIQPSDKTQVTNDDPLFYVV